MFFWSILISSSGLHVDFLRVLSSLLFTTQYYVCIFCFRNASCLSLLNLSEGPQMKLEAATFSFPLAPYIFLNALFAFSLTFSKYFSFPRPFLPALVEEYKLGGAADAQSTDNCCLFRILWQSDVNFFLSSGCDCGGLWHVTKRAAFVPVCRAELLNNLLTKWD